MFPLVLLLAATAYAEPDLSAVKALDEELPDFSSSKQSDEEAQIQRSTRKYLPPKRIIPLEKIKQSAVFYGAVRVGKHVRDIESNKNHEIKKLMYVRYYGLEDENGFKYLINKDGTIKWMVRSEYVEPIKEELALYEPPLRYTPAPTNIVRADYDKKLSVFPEVSFYTGMAQGDFMADLFEDTTARSGVSNQYGVHFFTQWKLPVKVGAVLHYERASYELNGGGKVIYSSPSLGPQIKSRDFEFAGQPLRFQTQFRVSPFAKAEADTIYGSGTFKFNSADLMASLERPVKNRFGEFVLGLYLQTQWLNIKDQDVPVSLKASNETNKSYGISFSQVFE